MQKTQLAGDVMKADLHQRIVLTIDHFDRPRLPRLSCHQLLEPPGAYPQSEWCGRGAADNGPPDANMPGITSVAGVGL